MDLYRALGHASRTTRHTLLLALLAAAPGLAQGEGRVVHAWEFSTAADVAAWSPVRTTPPALRDGTLVVRAEERDPQIVAADFAFPTSPFQVLEIRLRSSKAGTATLFWSGTKEGRWGGFEDAKRTEFTVPGDGRFHDYVLHPFWHAEKQLIRFRLDPPESAEIAVDAIRVREVPAPAGSAATSWASTAGWRPVTYGRETLLLSPPVDAAADAWPFVACGVAARGEGTARLYWVAAETNGLQSRTFPLRPGEHVYNLDTAGLAAWKGRILAVGVSLPKGAAFRSVALAEEPQGAVDLHVAYFDLRDALNRAGRPATLLAAVENLGGTPAEGLRARLELPSGAGGRGGNAGIRLEPGETAEKHVGAVDFGERAQVAWRVRADKPGRYPAQLTLTRPGAPPVTARAHLALTAAPAAPASTGYVPEPTPVASDYEVGAYYYPGWATYDRWKVLDDFPERRPVLGYYREGSPEVADWHIRWAVEHGVRFFIYDWYWVKGARHNEAALHDGFFNARYRDRMKFCLLWANHNPEGTSSEDDLLDVTDFWIANYFRRPEYYTVNGRPVMVIFSPGRLTADMGAEGVKQGIRKVRERVRAAGFPDLYLVACASPDRAALQVLKEEGYDAASGYNYPGAGAFNDLRAPYSLAVSGYEAIWKQIADTGLVDYIPVTDPGWDSRPWQGEGARVRTGKTPELFRDMLVRARRFVDERTPAGRPRIVFVEAWNEAGEGAVIEPHRQWGFAHLDATRSVFTRAPAAHTDLAPVDVGLGPYDLEPAPLRTAWEFDTEGEREGWAWGYNLAESGVRNGALWGKAGTRDPAFVNPGVKLAARKFAAVEIRMKTDRGTEGQIYWATPNTRESNENSIRFPVTADNEFHVYRLELGKSPRWRGTITRLRLDPNEVAGSTTAVDYIRLVAR